MNKNKIAKTVFYSFMLAALLNTHASAAIIDVTVYGAKPNSFTDATESIKKAIAACSANEASLLSFPKGRYDFWPAGAEERNYYISNTSTAEECPSKLKRTGLLFEGKKHVTIEGNGSLFVFHGKMITFTFDHCSGIKLQNLEIDFERPSMSEMMFEDVSDTCVTVVIHPDSKFAIVDDKLKWYGEGWGMNRFHAILANPADSTMKYNSWQPFDRAKATSIATNRVRFSGDFKNQPYPPGAVLTIRDPVRDHVGMFINLSQNVTLINVQMHYMHGLGIISQFSENLLFDGVQVIPSHNRMIAAFADCLHFSGCRGAIVIQNCHFKGAHDDLVNVHGTQLRIIERIAANSVRLKFMHGQSYGFPAYFAGDTVHFIHSASLHDYAAAIVASAKLVSENEMIIVFSNPLPGALQKDDCIENITWTPSLTVQNCIFEATCTRGILVTTCRKVLINDNTFSKTGMQAILIADDASSWFESGAVKDVSITNNRFIKCGYNLGENNYVIAIAPENHLLEKKYYVHNNIRILNNNFITDSGALLSVKSTANVVFSNNTVHQLAKGVEPAFKLTACDKIDIQRNQFLDLKPIVAIAGMAEKSLTTDIQKVVVVKHQ